MEQFFHSFALFFSEYDFRGSGAFGTIEQGAAFTGYIDSYPWNGRVVPKLNPLFGMVVQQYAQGNADISAQGRVARFCHGDAQVFLASGYKYGALDTDGHRTFRKF